MQINFVSVQYLHMLEILQPRNTSHETVMTGIFRYWRILQDSTVYLEAVEVWICSITRVSMYSISSYLGP